MYDASKIIVGLLIFLALIAFPLWYNAAGGKADYVPQLEKPDTATQCVAEVAYMKANHMNLLDEWRDRVVRHGERLYVDHLGRTHEMSLTKTCLNCHANRDRFCNRCHDYMGVDPYCWDCHVDPKEVR